MNHIYLDYIRLYYNSSYDLMLLTFSTTVSIQKTQIPSLAEQATTTLYVIHYSVLLFTSKVASRAWPGLGSAAGPGKAGTREFTHFMRMITQLWLEKN